MRPPVQSTLPTAGASPVYQTHTSRPTLSLPTAYIETNILRAGLCLRCVVWATLTPSQRLRVMFPPSVQLHPVPEHLDRSLSVLCQSILHNDSSKAQSDLVLCRLRNSQRRARSNLVLRPIKASLASSDGEGLRYVYHRCIMMLLGGRLHIMLQVWGKDGTSSHSLHFARISNFIHTITTCSRTF